LPFLTKHCLACHGKDKPEADLSLARFTNDGSVIADRKTWDNIQHMLETREMPPVKQPKPMADEVEGVLAAIRGLFAHHDRNAKPNAGRVTMRRLNKTEYNNTIRDLVGIDFKPATDFPADDVGYGFDNIGDVLSVTPLLLEKYLSAGELVLEQALPIIDAPSSSRSRLDNLRVTSASTKYEMGGSVAFDAGDYFIRVRVGGDQVGDEKIRALIRVADKDVEEFEVTASKDRPQTLRAKVRMQAGTSRVTVMLMNPFSLPPPEPKPGEPAAEKPAEPREGERRREFGRFRPPEPVRDGRTRILFLDSIEVEGPFDPPPPELPPVSKRLLAHEPDLSPRDAATEIITRFATRAYRRPVTPDEVAACLKIYDREESRGRRFELCVRAAFLRVLVSPNFLFRVELDPPDVKPGTNYRIGEYELASRLSYFLWNSMPDDELFALAAKGELRTNLNQQVQRMVQDPKAVSFLHGFAEQWLTLRKLDLSSPDAKQFPAFDENLRKAMIKESDLLFEALVREDRSILDLLDADFTFVNEQLAKHYGIQGVRGKRFVRVPAPPHRGGILTQASILTLTSNATRTSPVKRGKFVLEQILNTPPPPPPADVPALEDQKQLTGTVRQVLEQHRASAVCASCHQRMDPIGFAFENFDPVGVWREKDGTADIDASGVLPDGREFAGPDGLKQILKSKKTLFVRCVAEKMLTYATGRGLEHYDRAAVDKIMAALEKNDYRFSILLAEVVNSDPFQMRTTPGETP
jgi:mono/diheme cytochrome c family protein